MTVSMQLKPKNYNDQSFMLCRARPTACSKSEHMCSGATCRCLAVFAGSASTVLQLACNAKGRAHTVCYLPWAGAGHQSAPLQHICSSTTAIMIASNMHTLHCTLGEYQQHQATESAREVNDRGAGELTLLFLSALYQLQPSSVHPQPGSGCSQLSNHQSNVRHAPAAQSTYSC